MDLITDTSFVLAVLDRDDKNHARSRDFFSAAPGRTLLPAVTLPELAYHLDRLGGNKLVVQAFQTIRQGRLIITALVDSDYDRALDILSKYSDSRIDFVDACIMALAERLKITRILTFDRRDFGLYRPAHCDYFELLP